MQPGFFNHLLLICQFEIKRGFATRKGLLSLITFAVIWYFILLYPLRFAAGLVVQGNSLHQHFSFFDFIGFGSIQHWPISEFDVFWHLALMLFPILVSRLQLIKPALIGSEAPYVYCDAQ